jgi:hypothetical protein
MNVLKVLLSFVTALSGYAIIYFIDFPVWKATAGTF